MTSLMSSLLSQTKLKSATILIVAECTNHSFAYPSFQVLSHLKDVSINACADDHQQGPSAPAKWLEQYLSDSNLSLPDALTAAGCSFVLLPPLELTEAAGSSGNSQRLQQQQQLEVGHCYHHALQAT